MRSPTAFSDENITPGTFNAIIFNLHAGDWKPKLTGKPLDDIHMNQWGSPVVVTHYPFQEQVLK
jgi:hypothetical protein